MKLLKNSWMPWEDEWLSLEDSIRHRKLSNGTEDKHEKEDNFMRINVHNNLGINYSKTLSTIKFFVKNVFSKFPLRKKWKIDVWLDEKQAKNNQKVSCGVSLTRPKKGKLYVKKTSGSLNESIKECLMILEKSLKKEKFQNYKRPQDLLAS